ncbi:hypothetical protein Patl1_33419 [Pistacia atlantica]|uniref:Uncharacterized protein n=1 Tax=Pistacia atlantica TaxID=434234 RepID=A0ACC0ZSE7_9ROSI|nr:hypothetical protein Patl1_33419 [Pistacia atlantica]
MGFQECKLPVKFMAVPLISTWLKYRDCLPFIEKGFNLLTSQNGDQKDREDDKVLFMGKLSLFLQEHDWKGYGQHEDDLKLCVAYADVIFHQVCLLEWGATAYNRQLPFLSPVRVCRFGCAG